MEIQAAQQAIARDWFSALETDGHLSALRNDRQDTSGSWR